MNSPVFTLSLPAAERDVKSVDSWSSWLFRLLLCIPNQPRKFKSNSEHKCARYAKQRGLSQEELAFSCNLDRTYIGSVERGERNISLVNIHIVAAALKVSPREFFND